MTSAGQAASIDTPPLTHRETLLIVFGVLIPVFMGSLDTSIVSPALATIGGQMGETAGLSWVITAYLLTTTASTPLYGKISDIKGRRVTLLAAILIFLVGSVACALAPSVFTLVLARALQGIGGGGLITQSMTILGDIAPPRQRARYYAWFSVIYTIAGTIGPALGGYFAQYLDWTLIFWINVPMGLFAYAVTSRLLRRLPRHEKPHRLDIPGALLMVCAALASMSVLDLGGVSLPWSSPEILGLSALGALCWAGFAWRLRTAPEPFIPLHVLANPIVRWAALSSAFGWAGLVGLSIYLPLYLQVIVHMSPTEAGVHLAVVLATVNFSAFFSAQATARLTHYKRVPVITLLASIAGCVWLTLRAADIGVWEFQIAVAMIGAGFGTVAPVTSVSVQNTVRLSELGTSMAGMNFVRSLFTTALVALFGVIIFHQLPPGPGIGEAAGAISGAPDKTAAILSSFRIVFGLAALCMAGSFLALVAMEERPLATSNENRR